MVWGRPGLCWAARRPTPAVGWRPIPAVGWRAPAARLHSAVASIAPRGRREETVAQRREPSDRGACGFGLLFAGRPTS